MFERVKRIRILHKEEREERKEKIALTPQDALLRNSEKLLSQRNQIDSQLYIENDVKRGLRNANGTGVIVGLTHIGEVVGYTIDEQGNKIPAEGKLYYRG